MSGLAKYCLAAGFKVTGSDRAAGEQTERLTRAGAQVFIGHSAENVRGADVLVYTSAAGADNPEITEGIKRGIPIYKRSELLGNILSSYPRSVAVAGSHGKTTVTAMLWEIFERAGKDPAVFLGGDYGEKGNFRAGSGRFAIAEACEYRQNFLDLHPYMAVILDIDNDHLESFGSFENEVKAFRRFASRCIATVNADDPFAACLSTTSVTFGMETPAVYTAKNLIKGNNGYSFGFYAYGRKEGRVRLNISGRHNVYNALAAAAAAKECGVSFSYIKSGLENFYGVKRRNERIGSMCGKPVFCDYAHHPSELRATLLSYTENGRDPLVIFQPHTYSRTKILMKDFIAVLKTPRTVIYKTYPARESFDKDGDGETLYKNLAAEGADCTYADTLSALSDKIRRGMAGKDCILFLGAGDIYEAALKLAK